MNILNKISELRKARNWTEYRLSEEADLPQSTVSSWYRKNMTPSIVSLEKICRAFGITMSQFFASSTDLIELTEEQKQVLNKWDALTEKQKKALLMFFDNN